MPEYEPHTALCQTEVGMSGVGLGGLGAEAVPGRAPAPVRVHALRRSLARDGLPDDGTDVPAPEIADPGFGGVGHGTDARRFNRLPS